MKRITSIQLENFRAFYGKYAPIQLGNGENLLLYGENGSGKSSLFKALKSYFQSSRNSNTSFEINTDAIPPVHGAVNVEFSEYDILNKRVIQNTSQSFSFTSSISNNTEQFIKDADLVKGFLDYRILLQVYIDKNPNLFHLIINELLFEKIPIGARQSLGKTWREINTYLSTLDGRFNKYKWAISELPRYHSTLNTILKRIFLRLNLFLGRYFKLNLRVSYTLPPIRFNPNTKHINADLRLLLKLNGKNIANHTEYLNEARLSALSVCLYLASLKENPINFDYKILFLDDVFIGLDSSNRIPILKIIYEEFKEHQIFITTYDRYWFEVAQRFFKSQTSENWVFTNFYAGKDLINEFVIDKPLIIHNVDDFSKAVYHLHHPSIPDYPASANYFRKFAEELLVSHLPSHEIRQEDYSLIENYKLTNLVKSGLKFLHKIGFEPSLLLQLRNSLSTILHPLSHFNLTSPIYKGELIEIQTCLSKLEPFLKNIKNRFRILFTQGRMFKLKFQINITDYGYFEIFSNEAIYVIKDDAGILNLSTGQCHAQCTYIISNNIEISRTLFRKTNTQAKYTSLENAYNKIFDFISAQQAYQHIVRAANYSTEFEIADNGTWTTLDELITW